MSRPAPKRSLVISFDEDEGKLVFCSVNDSAIASAVAGALKVDFPLETVNHEITDPVALRIGTTAVSVLSIYHPALKAMLKTTPLDVPS
ncbi:hypothetical protein [Burkholderia vietnamiensis]|uniref:hypothetical protein n=1 Tax=Burkholderia vietnamiensis TaxID=60552 RepID=UPI001CF554D3|nr:hypothetical protein [Burkholderia vietnamiensis]MCA8016144.1 hypothetical protein [Burkholderia vietnamiensis]MDN8035341.1 hypothetical protein [Burkholderia vietnamiensis]